MIPPRRILVALWFTLAVAAASVGAAAEQPAARRIGLLSIGADTTRPPLWVPFFDEMEARGYVEGRSIIFDRRFAAGREELVERFAAELVESRVDAIVVTGTREAAAARRATETIPIVTMLVADPVGSGIVKSLARPGGNVTGLTTMDPALYGKRIEILKDAVPRLRKAALLVSPGNLTYRPDSAWARDLVAAARSIEVELAILVAAPEHAEEMIAPAAAAGAQALVVALDAPYVTRRKEIAEIALRHRLATMFALREHVVAGGLMAYEARSPDLARRAAEYLDRILRGTRPEELPVEQPITFDLIVNLQTARALGLDLPPALLARADEVIE